MFIVLVYGLTVWNGCATHKAQYKDKIHKTQNLPDKEIDRTFYLIGDAGISPEGGMSAALTAFKNRTANKRTKDDYAIFLGDNSYPAGLPAKKEKGRENAENALNGQIQSLENFEGEILFIPGNHDWYSDGLKGLKRQENI